MLSHNVTQRHKERRRHRSVHCVILRVYVAQRQRQRHSADQSPLSTPLLIHTLRHFLLFHRRARTQAEEAEQQKLEMETLAERLVEADKRGDVAEKGFDDHKIYEKKVFMGITKSMKWCQYTLSEG